jgi:hypothetical protein
MTVMDVETLETLLTLIRPVTNEIAKTADSRISSGGDYFGVALKVSEARDLIKATLMLEGLLMARKTGR